MKVPSTSLPQYTSRASLVSAGKNHVGYFLNSPRTLTRHEACRRMFIFPSCSHCGHVTEQKCNVPVNKRAYDSPIAILIKMHAAGYNCSMQTDEQRQGDWRSTPISAKSQHYAADETKDSKICETLQQILFSDINMELYIHVTMHRNTFLFK